MNTGSIRDGSCRKRWGTKGFRMGKNFRVEFREEEFQGQKGLDLWFRQLDPKPNTVLFWT